MREVNCGPGSTPAEGRSFGSGTGTAEKDAVASRGCRPTSLGCVSFHAAAALIILLASGCATSTKLVTRTPDASLMVPCEKPAPLPPKPSGNVIDKALVNTTKLLLDCKAKHDGLVEFENAAPKQQ